MMLEAIETIKNKHGLKLGWVAYYDAAAIEIHTDDGNGNGDFVADVPEREDLDYWFNLYENATTHEQIERINRRIFKSSDRRRRIY